MGNDNSPVRRFFNAFAATASVAARGSSSVELTVVEQRQLARRVAQMRKQEGGLLGEGRVVREAFFAVGDGVDAVTRLLRR